MIILLALEGICIELHFEINEMYKNRCINSE